MLDELALPPVPLRQLRKGVTRLNYTPSGTTSTPSNYANLLLMEHYMLLSLTELDFCKEFQLFSLNYNSDTFFIIYQDT